MIAHPELRISLLGEFRVEMGDKPITAVNTPRLRTLLAYILLHRDTELPRQHLAFLFWPDSSEKQALSNLRNILSFLRSNFPDAERYIHIGQQNLAWRSDSPFVLDVALFEKSLARARYALQSPDQQARSTLNSNGNLPPGKGAGGRSTDILQETVDLYTGDLLPSCYDEWILAPREHLKQGFLWALSALVVSLESAGDLNTAILYAHRLLRSDPLQEENYRRVMRLHLSMADRAGVSNIYRQCARMLRRELGIEPSDATQQLLREADALAGKKGGKVPSDLAGTRGQWRVAATSNLPAQTTAFIGREREVADLARRLSQPEVRLVTLTGTAGTGKTRLALQVASILSQFRNRTFVSLAPLSEPEMVERSIAQALGVTESANRSLRDALIEAFHDKQALLILDNFEHLLPAAALVAELLAACPNLKVLATSRSSLNIRGEHEYTVPTMSTPGHNVPPEPDDLTSYEAVALFVERALEVSPQFALTRGNARAVAEICRRLEGVPLAIELAAVRVKVLTPEAILARLDRRLKLLVGGKIDLPTRQRTLEAAIEWSYNLLDTEEKKLFRLLGVFSGGFSLDAVAAITRNEDSARCLDALLILLDKSLLSRQQAAEADELRFGMLETLKEYAANQLIANGEAEDAHDQHLLYFLALAESSAPHLKENDHRRWAALLEAEHDNLRAALRHALDPVAGKAEEALRMVAALSPFWIAQGHFDDGLTWIEQATSFVSKDDTRLSVYYGIALSSAGLIAERQGNYKRAAELHSQSVALLEAGGHKAALADALNNQALLAALDGYELAIGLHKRSLDLRREVGDLRSVAQSLINIGHVNMQRRDYAQARLYAEEALPLARQTGNRITLSGVLYVLGMVALDTDNLIRAASHLQEGAELARADGNKWLTARIRMGHGQALYALGEHRHAMMAYVEAEALYSDLGDRWGVALAHTSFARDAHRRGDLLEAAREYKQALQIGLEIEDGFVCGCSLGGIAGLLGEAGKASEAALLYGFAERAAGEPLARYGLTLGLDKARTHLGDQWDTKHSTGATMDAQDALSLAATISFLFYD